MWNGILKHDFYTQKQKAFQLSLNVKINNILHIKLSMQRHVFENYLRAYNKKLWPLIYHEIQWHMRNNEQIFILAK